MKDNLHVAGIHTALDILRFAAFFNFRCSIEFLKIVIFVNSNHQKQVDCRPTKLAWFFPSPRMSHPLNIYI